MGVHELWGVLEPVREFVPVQSLRGKTLAVDLSLWVCEAQHVHAMAGRVTRPHLRNLFFRVSALTLMGVKLVFVMEGEAPKLKEETMKRRNDTRFRGRGGGGGGGGGEGIVVKKAPVNTSRGRFKAVLRECSELLDYLGVPYLSAAGEAEAYCALLDASGAVDGCITNDGDAFLYGAKTVYRNFNLNTKSPVVECYRSSRLLSELRLSRDNLVALGVLLGCDFLPKGVPGVGREQALKLLHTLRGASLLEKFSQWGAEPLTASIGVPKKVPHCNVCRHPGSVRSHQVSGCPLCSSERFCSPRDFDQPCPCDAHRHGNALEDNVRRKTLASPDFPFSEIISEFLVPKDEPRFNFPRKKPNLLLLQRFALDKLEWPKCYTSQKVLILMTYAEMINRTTRPDSTPRIRPIRILKARVKNGVACWEIAWTPPEGFVFAEDVPAEEEVTTVEEASLFGLSFPELVENYWREKEEEESKKGKKKKNSRKKGVELPDDSGGISHLVAQMSLQAHQDTPPCQDLPPCLDTPHCQDPPTHDAMVPDSPEVSKQTVELSGSGSGCSGASPSVSAIVNNLHLSDIDWDSASFLATPPSDRDAAKKTSVESRKSPETQSSVERPLRERLLARSIATDSILARSVASSSIAARNGLLDDVADRNVAAGDVLACSIVAKGMVASSVVVRSGSMKDVVTSRDVAARSVAASSKEALSMAARNMAEKQEVCEDSFPRRLQLQNGRLLPGLSTETEPEKNHQIGTGLKANEDFEKLGGGQDGGKTGGEKKKKTSVLQKPHGTASIAQSDPCRSRSDLGRSQERAEPKATRTVKRSVCVGRRSSDEEEEDEDRWNRRNRTRTGSGFRVPHCQSGSAEPHRPGEKHQDQNQRMLTDDVIVIDDVIDLKDHGVADVIGVDDVDDVVDDVDDLEDSVFGAASPLPLAERLRLKSLK